MLFMLLVVLFYFSLHASFSLGLFPRTKFSGGPKGLRSTGICGWWEGGPWDFSLITFFVLCALFLFLSNFVFCEFLKLMGLIVCSSQALVFLALFFVLLKPLPPRYPTPGLAGDEDCWLEQANDGAPHPRGTVIFITGLLFPGSTPLPLLGWILVWFYICLFIWVDFFFVLLFYWAY